MSFIILPLIFLIMIHPNANGQYPADLDKLLKGSSLVFKAKIIVLHSVTTDEDDASNSGVVTVNSVLDAPDAFKNISGQQVTVHFLDISKAQVGEERIFFSEPYWIGESLGVTEIGSVMKGDKLFEDRDISLLIRQARTKQDNEKLKAILTEARLVFSGKVISTAVPKGYKRMATEHDPEWMEAEIQIDEMIKGKSEIKIIRILFASSKDLMFDDSPKFKKGDDGIFVTQTTDAATIKLIQNENMVIDPSGFMRGREKINMIKTLIR